MFAHNVFTVQFMFDRLPLYIIAFYPALSALAYEVVRALGVFNQRGPLAGCILRRPWSARSSTRSSNNLGHS